MPRIHLTGPVTGLERWLDAARAAGWEALAHPLLAVEPRPLDAARLPYGPAAAPDWLCVTSANALPALRELLGARPDWRVVPAAAVGARTGAGVEATGLTLALPPAADAADLARALCAAAHPGARVLWLRGDRAHELAERLRAGGLAVDEPVVYATVRRPAPAPTPSAAVLLASPSAVDAWTETVPSDADVERAALAIGATTLRALEPHARRFAAVRALAEPTPEALTALLHELAPSPGR